MVKSGVVAVGVVVGAPWCARHGALAGSGVLDGQGLSKQVVDLVFCLERSGGCLDRSRVWLHRLQSKIAEAASIKIVDAMTFSLVKTVSITMSICR